MAAQIKFLQQRRNGPRARKRTPRNHHWQNSDWRRGEQREKRTRVELCKAAGIPARAVKVVTIEP
jgi:hypothetical protein